jgi:uncharacterized protein
VTEVKDLYYYPFKGLSGTFLETAIINETGVIHDRAFAFAFKDSIQPENVGTPPEEYPWTSKARLAVQNDWPGLAALKASVSHDEYLEITDSNLNTYRWNLKSKEDRAKAGEFISNYLKTIQPSPAAKHPIATDVTLVGLYENKTRFPDRVKEHVSILNLASLRDLEKSVGQSIDVRRFRGNIIIDDPKPWVESEWLGKRIAIGDVEIECTSFIGRCYNINVNPDSGIADLDLLQPLKELCNQKIGRNLSLFGILGRIVNTGTIRRGEVLWVPEPVNFKPL